MFIPKGCFNIGWVWILLEYIAFADGVSNISMNNLSVSSNNIMLVTGYTGTGKLTLQISYYEQKASWLSAYTTCQTRNQGELLRNSDINLTTDVLHANYIDNATEIWTSIIYPIHGDPGPSSWFDAYSCEGYLYQQAYYNTDTCLSVTVQEISNVRHCADSYNFACILNTEPFTYYAGMDVSKESTILFLVDTKVVTANECLEFCVNRQACVAFTVYTNASTCLIYSLTNATKKLIEYNITNSIQPATHTIKNQNTFIVKPDIPLPANFTYPSCPQTGAVFSAAKTLPLGSPSEKSTTTMKPSLDDSTSTSAQSGSVTLSSQTYTSDKPIRYSYSITPASSMFLETNTISGYGCIDSSSADIFTGTMHSSPSLPPSYFLTSGVNTLGLHSQYTPDASLPASQQLFATRKINENSPNTFATTLMLESSYNVAQNLGTKCSCQVMDTSVALAASRQHIRENIEKIKEELHIDRKSTNTYIRGLTSADDKRTSAQTIGASAVVILIGLLLTLVILDLNNFYQSWLVLLDNVRDLYPRNQP